MSRKALDHFDRHRQTRFWHLEAGGLLFARFDGARTIVDLATGPRPTDRRGRCSYRPDRMAEQREIDENHATGLHFVGTWHTHPEDRPSPSPVDMASIADIFRRSRHALNGFAMVIVGRDPGPEGMYVGLWDGAVIHKLAEGPIEDDPVADQTRPGSS
ncbi:Mov34/MPN/PAD-1 family protein [Lichenihabitans psoromatis]|uniref:Mov34/MPN/PAD-1 family protein n=1 Tax=Lichenihabitans psoromatis TaxID=2528642 RepID=UPI001FE1720C|nr:Mov34/MPN/PAD-1 family protein [Lichenihabitans psoromatis]